MEPREKIAAGIERAGPYAGGAIVFAVALIWHRQIAAIFHWTSMSSKDAAGAAFNLMVTLTAFLFTVFVLAIAPGQGFLQSIFSTATFRVFKRYVAEALVIGGLAAILAIPFSTTPAGTGVWKLWWVTSMLLGALTIALLGFFRVAHIFLAWIGYRSHVRARGTAT